MVMPIGNDVTISNGGMVNDAMGISHYTDTAIYFGGTAVKFNASHAVDGDGNPWITPAGHTDRPIGYTMKSTLNPIVPYDYVTAAHYLSGVKTTVYRYREGDVISVPLASGHAAIEVGDKIGVSTTGEHDKFASIGGCAYSVGIALDPIAINIGAPGAAGINAECIRVRVLVEKEL